MEKRKAKIIGDALDSVAVNKADKRKMKKSKRIGYNELEARLKGIGFTIDYVSDLDTIDGFMYSVEASKGQMDVQLHVFDEGKWIEVYIDCPDGIVNAGGVSSVEEAINWIDREYKNKKSVRKGKTMNGRDKARANIVRKSRKSIRKSGLGGLFNYDDNMHYLINGNELYPNPTWDDVKSEIKSKVQWDWDKFGGDGVWSYIGGEHWGSPELERKWRSRIQDEGDSAVRELIDYIADDITDSVSQFYFENFDIPEFGLEFFSYADDDPDYMASTRKSRKGMRKSGNTPEDADDQEDELDTQGKGHVPMPEDADDTQDDLDTQGKGHVPMPESAEQGLDTPMKTGKKSARKGTRKGVRKSSDKQSWAEKVRDHIESRYGSWMTSQGNGITNNGDGTYSVDYYWGADSNFDMHNPGPYGMIDCEIYDNGGNTEALLAIVDHDGTELCDARCMSVDQVIEYLDSSMGRLGKSTRKSRKGIRKSAYTFPDSFIVGCEYGTMGFWKSGSTHGNTQQYFSSDARNTPGDMDVGVYLDITVEEWDSEDEEYIMSYVENYYDYDSETELEFDNGTCYGTASPDDRNRITRIYGLDSSVSDGIRYLIEEVNRGMKSTRKSRKTIRKSYQIEEWEDELKNFVRTSYPKMKIVDFCRRMDEDPLIAFNIVLEDNYEFIGMISISLRPGRIIVKGPHLSGETHGDIYGAEQDISEIISRMVSEYTEIDEYDPKIEAFLRGENVSFVASTRKSRKGMKKQSVATHGGQRYDGWQKYNQSPMMREAIDRHFTPEDEVVKSMNRRLEQIQTEKSNPSISKSVPGKVFNPRK